MKKYILLSSALLSAASGLQAQNAMDAYTYSQSQLRGTARYVSMGGAFGALGGDLSTLNQNPAGLGVYRSSEVGITLDVDFQNTKFQTFNNYVKEKETKFACDNFGYVGSAATRSSLMPYFNWGITYNRVNSFNRSYSGYFDAIGNSWTDFVANASTGLAPSALEGLYNYETNSAVYDPFIDTPSSPDWISALAYNCLLINDTPSGYVGLWNDGTPANDYRDATFGSAYAEVNESGYTDEYSINFGGNCIDKIYWGLAFGITDFEYRRTTYYEEDLYNALVPNQNFTALQSGDALWGIENMQRVSGTGFNLKLGLIFKPINEFRLGLAVHTPTWYKFNYCTNAWVNYGLGQKDPEGFYTFDSYVDDNRFATTMDRYWNNRFRTPWRLMASAAGVLGGRFIISADYVFENYPSMGFSDSYGEFADITNDIKQYYTPSSELRLGGEFRVTPSFSLRLGYNYKSSGVKADAYNAQEYIYTDGCLPKFGTETMFEMKGDRNNVTCGLGYRTGGFYIDLAYVYSTQKSQWYAYSSYPAAESGSYQLSPFYSTAPSATLTTTNNHLVLSLGYKF